MANRDSLSELPWPFGGLDEGQSYFHQRRGGRDQSPTYVDGENVRGFDPSNDRMRGSSRAGFSKYIDAQVNGSKRIQNLHHVVAMRDASFSATALAARTVKLVAVSDGTIKTASPGDSAWTTPTDGGSALQTNANAPFVTSAAMFSTLYFADGTNYKLYDPATDAVSTWTASAGSLPIDGSNTPRLIVPWHGRCVLAGIRTDPHNWFMSAATDPTDFNYSATGSLGAIAGNNAEQLGKCPDIINSMIPYTDEILLVLGDNSIHRFYGDPRDGGTIDLVTDSIGAPFGKPWCRDPQGVVYFMGIPGAIYRMVPGGLPEKVSYQRLETALRSINVSTKVVRLEWDEAEQGVHIFLTPLTAGATKHYFYEIRTDAFHRDSFGDTNMNPVATHVMDGDDPDDRVLLIGSEDGYVRKKDRTAKSDDGTAIASYVYIGPIQSNHHSRMMLKELQAMLSTDSNPVTWEIFSGESAQGAFASTVPHTSGTWDGGRSRAGVIRVSGHALYLKIGNSDLNTAWSVEHIHAVIESLGPIAQRML